MIDFSWHKKIQLLSGPEVVLRYPRIEDSEQLMSYINKFVDEDEFLLINEHQTLEQEKEFVQSVIQNLKDEKTVHIVGEYEGEIIAAGHVLKGRYKSSHIGSLGISIAKDFRNQGLGKFLMEELLRQAKEILGVKTIELTCFANNLTALSMYEKLGFIKFGILPKGYKYKNKEFIDQIFMYKEL